MKTTLDLPPDLVHQVKLHALHEGKKLKDAMAEMIRRGLSVKNSRGASHGNRVKLPLVRCRRSADLTPERVAGIEPLANQKAWASYEAFIADDRIVVRDEPAGLAAAWKKLAARRTASPKLWMDAYLAAFAIVAGAQLVTTDKAFKQFAGLNALVLKAD